jgi:hypothetical protein
MATREGKSYEDLFLPFPEMAINRKRRQRDGRISRLPKVAKCLYLKVVEAQLTFNQNAEDQVESVTLHKGGRDIVGKKMRK